MEQSEIVLWKSCGAVSFFLCAEINQEVVTSLHIQTKGVDYSLKVACFSTNLANSVTRHKILRSLPTTHAECFCDIHILYLQTSSSFPRKIILQFVNVLLNFSILQFLLSLFVLVYHINHKHQQQEHSNIKPSG